ncbi:hypothetical protein GQX73_g9334 [Xylaria multiplex]|uniref:RRM domain-containing protein n=1 Tax=Xylaria multiplex TaxID=323545 RepID=A0A7C8ILR0_9PEZI|nr:hypothetical protein GQX73_g9334 [Xylaria multiplex]
MTDKPDIQHCVTTGDEGSGRNLQEISNHQQENPKDHGSDHQQEDPKDHDPGNDKMDTNHGREESEYDQEEPKDSQRTSWRDQENPNDNRENTQLVRTRQQNYREHSRDYTHTEARNPILPQSSGQGNRLDRMRQHLPRINTDVYPVTVPRQIHPPVRQPTSLAPPLVDGTGMPPVYYQHFGVEGQFNTTVYVSNLSRSISYETLLSVLEGTGKITWISIIPPHQSGTNYAAAQISFWDRHGVIAFYRKCVIEGLFFGSSRLDVAPGAFTTPELNHSEKSRIVIVRGPQPVVNKAYLSWWAYERGVSFPTSSVETTLDWETGMQMMRWCFLSFKPAAQRFYRALEKQIRVPEAQDDNERRHWGPVRVSWG